MCWAALFSYSQIGSLSLADPVAWDRLPFSLSRLRFPLESGQAPKPKLISPEHLSSRLWPQPEPIITRQTIGWTKQPASRPIALSQCLTEPVAKHQITQTISPKSWRCPAGCWVLNHISMYSYFEREREREIGVWFGWSHDQCCLMSDSQLVSMTTHTRRSVCRQTFYANCITFLKDSAYSFKVCAVILCPHQHNCYG